MTEKNKQAKSVGPVQVKASELPAYCPTEQEDLSSSHPRVYIALEENKNGSCPYCGTQFELVED